MRIMYVQKICFSIYQFEFILFISYVVDVSSFRRHRQHCCSTLNASWGWFKRHRIKANPRFVFIQMENIKSAICFPPMSPQSSSGNTKKTTKDMAWENLGGEMVESIMDLGQMEDSMEKDASLEYLSSSVII